MNRCELLEKFFPTMKTLKDGSENSESDGETQEEVQTEE